MQEEPRARGAALTGVGENGEERAIDRFLQIGIREDDVRTLATELERDLLDRSRGRSHDLAASFGFPGERDLFHQGMRSQRFPEFFAGSGDDIEHAGRNSRLERDLTQNQGRQWGGAGRLEHDGVSGCKRRSNLPRRHEQGKVPRDDLGADAVRLAHRVIEQRTVHRNLVAPDLTCKVAVVLETVRRSDHVAARFDDDLAGVHRFQRADFVDPIPQDVGHLVQGARAIQRRKPTPWAGFERAMSGFDCRDSVPDSRLRDDANDLVGRWTHRLIRPGICRGQFLATDDQ